jgi:hypothetical protein
MIAQPVFLVASERSGTTLLRLMLDHHPQIAFFFEFAYSVVHMPEPEGWPDLDEYHRILETDRIFLAGDLTVDKNLDYPHLIDDFLRQKRDRDGKPIVGAVVHHNFDRLLRIWPDARFIHLIRDGRDVGRSYIEMGWAGNMYTAVEGWCEAEALWEKVSNMVPEGRRIDVRHETLVREPEATLTGICEFLGVPYDAAMFDYTKDSTYGPPSPKLIEQWKRRLSPEETRLAEARCGTLLTERGYELSGYPPLTVTPRMEKQLRRQSRWYCAMIRKKRFGTSLFLADIVSRRLRLQPWQQYVRKRINVIQEKYLK